jgi:hypothetical protein
MTTQDINHISANTTGGLQKLYFSTGATSATATYGICYRLRFQINQSPSSVQQITAYANWDGDRHDGSDPIINDDKALYIGNVASHQWVEVSEVSHSFQAQNSGTISNGVSDFVEQSNGSYYVNLLLLDNIYLTSSTTAGAYSDLYLGKLDITYSNQSSNPNCTLVHHDTFASSDGGWQNGVNYNAYGGYYESTIQGVDMASPNLDLSKYGKFTIITTLWANNATQMKIYPMTQYYSENDPNWYYEYDNTTGKDNLKIRISPNGPYHIVTPNNEFPINTNVTIEMEIDCTNNQTWGNVSWNGGSDTRPAVSGGCTNYDYTTINTGNHSGYVRIMDFAVYNGTCTPISGTQPTNNITITSESLNASTVAAGASVLLSTAISTTSGNIDGATAELEFPNGTRRNYTMTHLATGENDSNLIANDTFEGSTNNWGGNNTAGTDNGDRYIGISGGGLHLWSPDRALLTRQNYTLEITMASKDANYSKVHVASSCASHTGPRYMWEYQPNGIYAWAHENGNWGAVSNITSGQKVMARIFVDVTNHRSNSTLYNASNGALLGTIQYENWPTIYNPVGNCTTIDGGTQGSNSYFKLYQYTVWNSTGPAGDSQGASTTWQVTLTDTTAAGTYYIRNIWAHSTTGDSTTKATTLNFSVNSAPGAGTPVLTVLSPTTNEVDATYLRFFNVTLNVSCSGGNCGNVSAYLDPLRQTQATCYNGKSCWTNYNDIIKSATNNYNSGPIIWNHTQVFSGGSCGASTSCLWVPWYNTSSACLMKGKVNGGNLKTYGSSGPCSSESNLDSDTSVMVTDQFSETLIVLAVANASAETLFVDGMNTIDMLSAVGSLHQDLPGWVFCRDGTTITSPDSNSASDGTHRIVLALYLAGNNSEFNQSTRNRANQLAEKLMNQSIEEETTGASTTKSTRYYGSLAYWLFAGGNQAGFNPNPEEDMNIGYYQDALLACIAHAKHTGNAQYKTVCGNWTAQALAMAHYHGGTSASDLSHGHFKFWYNTTTGFVEPGAPPFLESFFGTANVWDDADAPRFWGLCRAWTAANLSGMYDMNAFPWKNLSDYCTAWNAKTTTWAATASSASACQQYKQNGDCQYGPYSGVFEVGVMSMGISQFNPDKFNFTQDEMNRHWSWASNSIIDSGTTCGSGLSYHHIRWPKSYIWGLGLDEGIYRGYSTPSSDALDKSFVSTSPGATPFWTNVSNPFTRANAACLGDMNAGSSCVVVWYVNATGTIGSKYKFYAFANSSLNAGVNSAQFNVTIR